MSAYFKYTSSMKSCTIGGKDSAIVSGVRYLKFNRNDITSDVDVSSTNDYQLTLDNSSGASFVLIGSTSIKGDGTDAESIFQFYDETNGSFIGRKGSIASNQGSSSTDQEDKNPCYRTSAIAVVLASDFSGSDITVSLRQVSSSGTVDYAFEPTGFETFSGFPCVQIYQSK